MKNHLAFIAFPLKSDQKNGLGAKPQEDGLLTDLQSGFAQ